MRIAKPYLRTQTGCYTVRLDGRDHNLGRDEIEAQRKYGELLAKRRRGQPTASGSLARLLDLYWVWLQANRAATTAENRKAILKSFGLFVGPKLTVDQLRPHHVNDWITKDHPDVGDTRKNILITTIKTVLNWAVEMGYIDVSPIGKMKKPSPTVREEFLPVGLWQKVLDAAGDDAFREWLRVMFESGARVEEMLRIEARHLDRDNRWLFFRAKESKGRRKARTIHLADESFGILCRLAEERPAGKLFLNTKGRPWNKDSINCRFRRLKVKLGLPKLRATDLRHSFAYDKLDAGTDSAHIATLMGHSDTRMLMTRYGHLSQNKRLLAAEANRTGFQRQEPPQQEPHAKAG